VASGILTKVSLVLIEETKFIPEIAPYFKVKFPPAVSAW